MCKTITQKNWTVNTYFHFTLGYMSIQIFCVVETLIFTKNS